MGLFVGRNDVIGNPVVAPIDANVPFDRLRGWVCVTKVLVMIIKLAAWGAAVV